MFPRLWFYRQVARSGGRRQLVAAPPDFSFIAQAYGIAAERLASLDGLPEALRRAHARCKPGLIEIGPDLVG